MGVHVWKLTFFTERSLFLMLLASDLMPFLMAINLFLIFYAYFYRYHGMHYKKR